MRSTHTPFRLHRMATVAGAALLTVTPVARAGEPGGPTTKASGRILAVDVAARSIRVRVPPSAAGDEPMELSIAMDPRTRFVNDGHSIVVADLRAGDSVGVVYRSSDGTNVAVSVTLQEE